MGGIGRAIGQMLLGVGEGLEKQTTANMTVQREREAAALAAQRQAALAALQHSDKMEEIGAQADVNDRNAARDDARGFAFGVQKDAQKFAQDKEIVTLKGSVDLSNDKAVKSLEHNYKLSEIQASAVADYAKQAKLDGETPDHYEKTANGQMVIWMKNGTTRGAIGADGMFVPPSEGQSGPPSILSGGSSTTARPPVSAVADKVTKPAATSVLSQLAKLPPPPGGKKGATATGPNGMRATWNGERWVLNDYGG